jgi:hypothetical protein
MPTLGAVLVTKRLFFLGAADDCGVSCCQFKTKAVSPRVTFVYTVLGMSFTGILLLRRKGFVALGEAYA